MNLQAKLAAFFGGLILLLIIAVLAIGLLSFRQYSIATATEHIRTAAEIVRVDLTEAMINGVIDKREGLLKRLEEVPGLKSVRVVRGPQVEHQFGKGLAQETAADDIERQVLVNGKAEFDLIDDENGAMFRGTVPFVATNRGNPNCLQCHQVAEGAVLGAVTISMSIDHLKRKAIVTLSMMVGAVALFALATFFFLHRLTKPISETARHVEDAVHPAVEGDFKSKITVRTQDEIGQIARDMNRLLAYLDDGLNRIGRMVAQLTNHAQSGNGNTNLLNSTIEMVETLTQAAHFKMAIEEDESKAEIYARLSDAVRLHFGVDHYSIYEVLPAHNQMLPMVVDGDAQGACR